MPKPISLEEEIKLRSVSPAEEKGTLGMRSYSWQKRRRWQKTRDIAPLDHREINEIEKAKL